MTVWCQQCGKRPATVQVSRRVQGQNETGYLCEQCASAYGQTGDAWWENLIGSFLPGPSLFGYPPPSSPLRRERTKRICPACKETERQLKETGLLGCGQCYETFADILEPVFRRVQGHTRHLEPVTPEEAPMKIGELRKRLERAVRDEAYEEAARLRDRIRQLEENGEDHD